MTHKQDSVLIEQSMEINTIQELGKVSVLTLGFAKGTMLEIDKPGFRLPPCW